METRLTLKQTQRLIMTPMLQQAIKLLPLQRMELIAKLRNELTENPLLEEEQVAEADQLEEKKPVESPLSVEDNSQTGSDNGNEVDWETYFQNTVYQGMPTDYVEKPSLDAYVKKEVTIGEHLVWQLNLSADSDSEKYIGTIIIGNINSDGYLEVGLDEISNITAKPVEEVESVLKLIQTFDPPGIGARDIQECLLIQAENLEEKNELVIPLINEYIERLDERNFPKIAKELQVKAGDIAAAVKIIREMNPKPGGSIEESDVQYITPDVYLIKKD
ncbi:MAG: RNA polymerase sigma-54 factor, partial [Nitrospinota bacterium]